MESDKKYCVEDALRSKCYQPLQEMCKTLQGSVYKSTHQQDDGVFAIKITDKKLHFARVTYQHSRRISIQENIVKEKRILQYLTEQNRRHPSCVRYVDFFEDAQNFFLVMEHHGDSLFAFVKQCHKYIEQGCISLAVWRSFVKRTMLQMVSLIQWMHCKMNCCHLDLSLENFLIRNVNISLNEPSREILNIDNFVITLVDFGVSEVFIEKDKNGRTNFKCNKFAGKTFYQSPELYSRAQEFDARSADCWSLAVCFFMMIVGSPPFSQPNCEDLLFKAIAVNHNLKRVLQSWNKMKYVTTDIMDLMNNLFVNEAQRFNIEQIAQHAYMRM